MARFSVDSFECLLLAVFSPSRQAEIGQKLLFVNGLSPKSAATGVRIASETTDRRAWLSSNAAFTASLAACLEVTALIADRVEAQLLVTIKQRLL